MFGKHRDSAVNEVDARGALLRLTVDNGAWQHIVRHIGDMHADLPVAVFQLAYGEGVVKVLGISRVYGECSDLAEVFAPRHFFIGNAGIDLVGSLLHSLRVAVGQAVLGKYGVHLGVVLPFPAEDIHDHTARCHLVVAPFLDACHSLVTVLCAVQLGARYEDVGSEELRVGHQHGDIVVVYLDLADKRLLLGLDDFHHAGLGVLSAP